MLAVMRWRFSVPSCGTNGLGQDDKSLHPLANLPNMCAHAPIRLQQKCAPRSTVFPWRAPATHLRTSEVLLVGKSAGTMPQLRGSKLAILHFS